MPQKPDPVELVRAVYRAMDEDDRTTLRSLLADDLRWRQAGSEVPAAGTDRVGADSFVRDVLDVLEEDWSGFREPVDQLIDAGSSVVAIGTYLATHQWTGNQLRVEFCHVWTTDEGRVVGFRQFTDTAGFAVARRWEDHLGPKALALFDRDRP